MKRFYLRLWIFSLPVFVFLAIPCYVLFTTGENFTDIDPVLAQEERYLIGYAYNEGNYGYLKWKKINISERYEVLAVGSSRVLPFRSNMFKKSFYNAGYTVVSIQDFLPFLRSLPKEKYPRYLILALDQWMFNENWDNLKNPPPDIDKWAKSFRKIPDIPVLVNVWGDLLPGKYGFFISDKTPNGLYIGLNAWVNNLGFRNDGSMFYGNQIKKLLVDDSTANDYGYHDTYSRINAGEQRFQYGENINPLALKVLDTLLQYCHQNSLEVVAFIPPFADKVNEKLNETGKYQYMDSIYIASCRVFDKYEFELYNFQSLKSFSSADFETLDGFHGGELSYTKMLIKMLESNSVLNEVADLFWLRQDLKNRKNRYEVY
ncbi:MAG: hypothetical protein SF052_08875 [Bacteroidia bacterium]|nr:hypothetical protein [Bacteroidia bacterium]